MEVAFVPVQLGFQLPAASQVAAEPSQCLGALVGIPSLLPVVPFLDGWDGRLVAVPPDVRMVAVDVEALGVGHVEELAPVGQRLLPGVGGAS